MPRAALHRSMSRSRSLASVIIVVVAAVVFLMPAPAGVEPVVMRAAGLVLFCVGLWATQALPEHITGLLFLLLVVLASVAPPNVAFSGFTSATLWLVLGGLVIAEAVRSTGLGERVALALLGRFTGSYPLLVTGTVLVSTLLMFVMPATLGRILLLIPVIAGLCRRLGFPPGSPGHNGLMLAGFFSTFQGGTAVLPANAPNLALAGAAEALHGVHLIYGEYLLVHFPVMGFLRLVLIIVLTCWLFPARIERLEPEGRREPMSGAEMRLAVLLAAALALWATDFAHGVRPGWIALGAALVAVMPRVGVLPVAAFNDRIKFAPYFYIGSVLGLGAVIVSSGLSAWIGSVAFGLLPLEQGADFRNFMVLALAAAVACLAATNPAQPGLIVPLAPQIAEATGWPLNAAIMISALGFSNVLLPYTVPPVVVGLQLVGIGFRETARYTLALAVPGFALLLPLDYLWWRAIGYFG